MGRLEEYVREKAAEKGQLIMTHQLLGYPNFKANLEAVKIFVKRKVDLIELQIPFSDPVADGPLFLRANQKSIAQGTTVQECFDFVEELIKTALEKEKLPVLIMTYYNIVFVYGTEKFLEKCKEIGVVGLIIPDAPVEECLELYSKGKQLDVSVIPIGTPGSSESRLKYLTEQGSGFLYYVPRNGVTGYKTDFDESILKQIAKAKSVSMLPLAVGFGIQTGKDLKSLWGSCSIAVIGSELMRAVDKGGSEELDRRMGEIMEDV